MKDAEQLMLGAFEYLSAMPDRERAYLTAGQRSAWPSIVRDVQADYPPDPGPPKVRVGRREAALVERMLTGEDAAALAVPVESRAMLGRLLAGKLWGVPTKEGREGFTWGVAWERERWLARRRGERLGLTSDGLRRRYERALACVARHLGTV